MLQAILSQLFTLFTGIKGMHADTKPRGGEIFASPVAPWPRGLVPVMPIVSPEKIRK